MKLNESMLYCCKEVFNFKYSIAKPKNGSRTNNFGTVRPKWIFY